MLSFGGVGERHGIAVSRPVSSVSCCRKACFLQRDAWLQSTSLEGRSLGDQLGLLFDIDLDCVATMNITGIQILLKSVKWFKSKHSQGWEVDSFHLSILKCQILFGG